MGRTTQDSTQTQRLLADVRAGQAEAFEDLFARHRAYLQLVASIRLEPELRRRVDPSDIVQDAHLEAARRLPEYLHNPAMPLRLWLRQITQDRLIMARRRHLGAGRRSVENELCLPNQSSVHLAEQIMAPGPSPSQHSVRAELAELVRRVISQMPEGEREVIVMRNYEGLSNLEAAQVLRIEPAAASKRYGRALLRLRGLLIEHGVAGHE